MTTDSSSGSSTALRLSDRAGRLVLIATIAGSGMAFIDTTVVNVALPAIGDDLQAGFASFQWIINGYLLALGSLLLLGGALGDHFGRRRVFVAGVVWFAVASIAVGLAPSAGWMIGFRVLQGIGAALLVPSSLAVIQTTFDSGQRGRAVGLWSGFSGISTLVGPVLGGWLIDAVSWRVVFLINPVVAIVAVVAILRALPEPLPHAAGRKVDVPGAAALVLGLGGIVYAATEGPRVGWGEPQIVAGMVLGFVVLAGFVLIESQTDDPMLPLRVFRSRRFTAVNGATALVYFTLSGLFFLLTIHLQRNLDYSALEAGLATTPVTVMLLALSPLAGWVADRFGPRVPMAVGPAVAAVGALLLRGVAPGSGYWADVLPGVSFFALGLGITVAPLTATALAALEDARAGLASGVNNAVARIAQLLAIPLLPLAAGMGTAEDVAGDVFRAGFRTAMLIAAGILVAGSVLSALTIRGRLNPD